MPKKSFLLRFDFHYSQLSKMILKMSKNKKIFECDMKCINKLIKERKEFIVIFYSNLISFFK